MSNQNPPLRAVSPDERPPKSTPKTIKAAVDMGERSLLVALRGRAAAEIDAGVPPAYLAPLMRQLRDIDKEIRAIDARSAEEAAEDADATADDAWEAV